MPLGLLALAAAFPILRLPVLLALVAGTAVAIGRDAPVRWTWAAGLPVAISLAWGVWPAPMAAADGSDCGSLASPGYDESDHARYLVAIRPCDVTVSEFPGLEIDLERPLLSQLEIPADIGFNVMCRTR